ncbi:hypothetical protein C8B47_03710 [filamentous cyanobacterium CCP4]|nr:hypothetical protein C8B47_03710 [filamentous cyanobacterium CCP4]
MMIARGSRMKGDRTIERVYYIYILYWYDPHPKAEIHERNGEQYAVSVRELGEADPIAMVSKEKLITIVKARTGRDDWQEIQHNRLWRLENYWLKREILGFNLKLDEIEYTENWREDMGDGRYKTWAKSDG